MSVIKQNKRLVLAAILAALIAAVFWSQSRVPALNEKAQMGLRTNFGDIAFEIVLPVTMEQPLVERILRSTVNWAATNLQGMTFGLLFAAAILTLLASLATRTFRRPSLNTLTGMFIGAPLGVCVNCATPIAFGIYSAGARLETALATLIASPTLNIFVLTMSFSLLPWELASAKLVGVLVVLALIPFLVRRFPQAVNLEAASSMASKSLASMSRMAAAPLPVGPESLAEAAKVTAVTFVRSLWYLLKFALPLMLLAGLLGSAAIEIVPFEFLSRDATGLGALVLAAAVAVFLPVPIAFDVIIVMALFTSGVDPGLAAALLFGLGIYSIYPALMIARYVSTKLSIAIAVTTFLIAVILGLAAQNYFGQKDDTQRALITSGVEQNSQALFEDAIDVCDLLPERLQMRCFSEHLGDFESLVSSQTICDHTPQFVSVTACQNAQRTRLATRRAVDSGELSICNALEDVNSQRSCRYTTTLKLAQSDRDIDRCNSLADASLVDACRSDYLNASLLFNPDDSACRQVSGAEQQTCKVNAAIYRLADTTNVDGCDTLQPVEARDHCRYTIASTMIGRHADRSACSKIEARTLAGRCNSLSVAWEAARTESLELCASVPQSDLADTCRLRVASSRIRKTLAESVFAGDLSASDVLDVAAAPSTGAGSKAPLLAWTMLNAADDIEIAYTDYSEKPTTPGSAFRQQAASTLGISHAWRFRALDFFEPFIIGKGIATGDYNNDDWPDLVFATNRGIRVYKNVGGRFEQVATQQGNLASANVFLVAFVDANNDGKEDIFATAYGGTNYLLLNDGEGFARSALQTFMGPQQLTLSAGFGDLNNDGLLDIVLGNWSSGIEKLFATTHSANTLMLRDGDGYDSQELAEIKGETNSVLIADVSGDHQNDLLIANDRLVPDVIYFSDATGSLQQLSKESNVVPLTSMFTMSLEVADFDNDLDIDIFATDMTFTRSSRDDYCAAIGDADERDVCKKTLDVFDSFQENDPSSCNTLQLAGDRQECFLAFLIKTAKDIKDPRFCKQLPTDRRTMHSLCEYLAAPSDSEDAVDQSRYFAQTQRNTLLLRSGDKFTEHAEAFGVDSSFWSWNAKAADLDNDGWQDIYVGNGFHFGDNFYEIQENVMYRNIEGRRFEQVQTAWNLDDPINTPSYVYIDFDLDGDLDIIATGVLASPRVFVNEMDVGNAVAFRLSDERSNSAAIGADITIYYGGDLGLQQRKQLKLSGGFLSFERPLIHFGIGSQTSVDRVVVRWPDGDSTVLDGPIVAQRLYKVVRRNEQQ